MSNVYQPKRKELAKVKVVSGETYSHNRSKYKFIGSVQRGYTAFVTTTRSQKTGKSSFIDDTSSLTKKTKNEVVKFFPDSKNRKKLTTAYNKYTNRRQLALVGVGDSSCGRDRNCGVVN